MTLRKGIQKVLDILKGEKDQGCCEDVNFILTFPTGYGKTTLSLELAKIISNNYTRNFSRIIHVVPTRALAKDIEERAEATGLDYAVQYSFSPSEIKSPEFLAKFVITTYDSFLLNLYKASVGEPYRSHGHYDLPRFSIYTSLVHFDEFHLMNDDKSWTSLITAVRHLSRMGVNMILSSATPSWKIERELIRMMENREIKKLAIVNDFGQAVKKQNCKLEKTDDDDIAYYECTVDSVKYETIEIKENLKVPDIDIGYVNGGIDEIVNKIKENKGERILIVANTVENAIKIYESLKKELKDLSICLLHSRFKIKDREEIFNKIGDEWKCGNGKGERGCDVIVATQVIEVGVNLSAEVLITEQAPITSIVQRAGRLLRCDSEKEKQGKLYVWKSGNTEPYDKDEVENTVSKLEELTKNNKNISLKLPYGNENLVGYADIVDEVIKPPEVHIGLVLDLEDIAENIFATKEDLNNLLDQYCNITRDSFIVNVATEAPQDEKELIPLEGNLVKKVVVKDKNEEGKECIRAYVEEFYINKATETDEVKLNEICIGIDTNKLENFCKQYRRVYESNKTKYVIYALKVDEKKYNKDTGLRI